MEVDTLPLAVDRRRNLGSQVGNVADAWGTHTGDEVVHQYEEAGHAFVEGVVVDMPVAGAAGSKENRRQDKTGS